jgi:hypothetical protein
MANSCNRLKRKIACRFSQHSITEHGWAPTFTEFGEATGIGSLGHVQ